MCINSNLNNVYLYGSNIRVLKSTPINSILNIDTVLAVGKIVIVSIQGYLTNLNFGQKYVQLCSIPLRNVYPCHLFGIIWGENIGYEIIHFNLKEDNGSTIVQNDGQCMNINRKNFRLNIVYVCR